MIPMSGPEREMMQLTHAGVMLDTCQVLEPREGEADEYGKKPIDYVAVATLPCQYIPLLAREARPYGAELPIAEARVLLPLGTVINNTYRLRITKRFNQAITPFTLLIVSPPVEQLVGVECQVRSV